MNTEDVRTVYIPDTKTMKALDIKTFDQLEADIQHAPQEFLIDGLISKPSLTLVVGKSGIGKSPLMYQAMLAVNKGIPFLGRNTRQGAILYVDCENSERQQHDILSQLTKHLGVTLKGHESFRLRNLNSGVNVNIEAMIRDVRPEVVVIDPLNAIFPDIEQDNVTAGKALHTLRGWIAGNGCAIIGVHHPRKATSNDTGGVPSLETADLGEWFSHARGPGILINGVDLRLGVEPTSQNQLIVRGFRRVSGEIPAIRILRVIDADGEPVGYRQIVGAEILSANPDQLACFESLPTEFSFADAMRAYGRQNNPTSLMLGKWMAAGLLMKPAKGRYVKVPRPKIPAEWGGGELTELGS